MYDHKHPQAATALTRLLNIMATLRDPKHGCPWDRAQSMQSLTRYTIEEAYEVADAIERNVSAEIKDELGDLLFQIVFYAQLGGEQGDFDFADIANAISDKMVRRHPHVFADKKVADNQLSQQWEAIKRAESEGDAESVLSSVAKGLPALMYAHKIQKKCATVGFDWPAVTPVLAKVREEIDEVQQELDAPTRDQQALEEELGDLLFAVVNLTRHCEVDADAALRRASIKFAKRFRGVEALSRAQQAELSELPLAELERLWQKVKAQEK